MADVASPVSAYVRSASAGFLPLLLSAAGFALTLYVFYPGIMNYDARYVYLDSLQKSYGDWQSPVMTWLWAAIDPVAPGSASMFLLIAALYWLGVGVLARAFAERSLPLGLAFPLLAISPPLFALVGVIWRDVLMAGSWLLASAIIFAFSSSRSGWSTAMRMLAILLIAFGVLLRPNALAAAPILIGYALWPLRFSWLRNAILYLPAAIVLYGTVQLVYYGALGAKRQHPLHSIVVFDLGGISFFARENQFPVRWSEAETEGLLGRCYDPAVWNIYWNGECKFVMERIEHTEKQFGTSILTSAWMKALESHPLAYIEHRLAFFRSFLFSYHLGMWTENIDNIPATIFEDRSAFMTLKNVHDGLRATPLLRIATWFAGCMLLCALVWRRRNTPEGAFVICVCGSAVIYVFSYLPLGVASEFRYGYWAVVASAAGLLASLLPRTVPKSSGHGSTINP